MHLSGFQVVWRPSSDWLQPHVWGWQVLSCSCHQPCAACKETMPVAMTWSPSSMDCSVGVVGPRRLKKRANGPSCGARGRKQCERLWFRQSPHLKGIVALQNQELIECWPDTGTQPPYLPRQMPFPCSIKLPRSLGGKGISCWNVWRAESTNSSRVASAMGILPASR